MKGKIRFLVTLAMIFSMFVATFSQSASVEASEPLRDSEGNLVSDIELAELEKQLEFITEEASVYNDAGQFLGFDMEKIQTAFGTDFDVPHLAAPGPGEVILMPKPQLPRPGTVGGGGYTTDPYNPGVSIASATVDRCINNKIKANYGAVFSYSTYQTILSLLYKKAFGAAAKELLKVGVKGNAATIGVTLSYYFFSCLPLRAK